ncbi:cytidine deaminase-like protein [Westerdykella ornata]|uniref:Cytidine deaminase-like protein n=1 Tax=Westerdykella ornata TaxID=318751 RepID=A0A6A6JFW8_WESOR|nr:cytidine deaminase-like protein [Westerdykella ornata]KAF2274089.1 cytidine deaminase-like protein [Westerdykella ornata]
MAASNHISYMRQALDEARKSPPKPSNYRVGALLIDASSSTVIATGYTLELPGNTHAEQCCLQKYAESHGVSEEEVGTVLPEATILYTTMEPCNLRLSGNLPCVERILRTRRKDGTLAISTVYVGVSEPEKFVGENQGRRRLEDAGVKVVHVSGLEEEILEVATAGHEK